MNGQDINSNDNYFKSTLTLITSFNNIVLNLNLSLKQLKATIVCHTKLLIIESTLYDVPIYQQQVKPVVQRIALNNIDENHFFNSIFHRICWNSDLIEMELARIKLSINIRHVWWLVIYYYKIISRHILLRPYSFSKYYLTCQKWTVEIKINIHFSKFNVI